jgi:hypothetical protein
MATTSSGENSLPAAEQAAALSDEGNAHLEAVSFPSEMALSTAYSTNIEVVQNE